jgi:membrane fusion protein, multidrug efflux system
VVASVSSGEVAAIRASGRARVEVPAANRWFEARAITIVPAADPRTHSTEVRVELGEGVSGIYPGVFARAHFVTGRALRLMAPREAILRRGELTAVYVLPAAGPPQLRQVRLGALVDERGIEVLAGLKPGERVALDPPAAGMATPARR